MPEELKRQSGSPIPEIQTTGKIKTGEGLVEILQNAGFDLKRFTIHGPDLRGEDHVVDGHKATGATCRFKTARSRKAIKKETHYGNQTH